MKDEPAIPVERLDAMRLARLSADSVIPTEAKLPEESASATQACASGRAA